mmetsp:Transcript_9456/g.29570  ORF Transcript_9456/g.29570 Transcript_9456/m.29570 type:complete len:218 (-) Transcript_9456:132-785(-)
MSPDSAMASSALVTAVLPAPLLCSMSKQICALNGRLLRSSRSLTKFLVSPAPSVLGLALAAPTVPPPLAPLVAPLPRTVGFFSALAPLGFFSLAALGAFLGTLGAFSFLTFLAGGSSSSSSFSSSTTSSMSSSSSSAASACPASVSKSLPSSTSCGSQSKSESSAASSAARRAAADFLRSRTMSFRALTPAPRPSASFGGRPAAPRRGTTARQMRAP